MRERQGNVVSRTSPTSGMLAGDFSAIGNTIYDHQTTAPNPAGSGTIAPRSQAIVFPRRLSPQAAFFNSYLTTAGTPGGVFTFSPSTVLDEDQLTTRIDHNLGDRNKIFFRYSLNDNRLGEPDGAPALGNANSSAARMTPPASPAIFARRYSTSSASISSTG
jgi:hypothetical protein